MAVSSPQVVEGEEMQREREGDEAREAGDSGEDEEKEEEGDAAEKTPAVEEAVEKTDAQAQVLLCVYTHTHTHTHTRMHLCSRAFAPSPLASCLAPLGRSHGAGSDLRMACRSCPGSRRIW